MYNATLSFQMDNYRDITVFDKKKTSKRNGKLHLIETYKVARGISDKK